MVTTDNKQRRHKLTGYTLCLPSPLPILICTAIITLLSASEVFAHGPTIIGTTTLAVDLFGSSETYQFSIQKSLIYIPGNDRLGEYGYGKIVFGGYGKLGNGDNRWRIGILEVDGRMNKSYREDKVVNSYTRLQVSLLDMNSINTLQHDFIYARFGYGIGRFLTSLKHEDKDGTDNHIGIDITPSLALRSFSLGANYPDISKNNSVMYSGVQAAAEGRVVFFSYNDGSITLYGKSAYTFAKEPLTELSSGCQISIRSGFGTIDLSTEYSRTILSGQTQDMLQGRFGATLFL